MEQKPQVTICVAHWHVKERIRLSLHAICKYAKGVPCEIIVVDNGRQDESLDYLRSLPGIRLIERGEQMYYHLQETGYRAEVMATADMMQYVVHLAHATVELRPEQRRLHRQRTQRKSGRRLHRLFASDLARSLAAHETPDRSRRSRRLSAQE